ncbi:MAG: BatA domain-containing protein [Salibacteraceae bacterium]
MKFLYPQFLYALFSLVIPVIIHLFNFQRYRKVYFSNVSFLKEVKHSTKAKSNLKHLLILISRMLAISALVIAFAQPFIPLSDVSQSNNKPSSLFIDDSYSAQNRSEKGIILDLARQFGLELVQELPKSSNHQFLSNDFLGSQQHLYPTTELEKKIGALSNSPNSNNFQKIIKRQSTAFENEKYASYIISDFQKNQYDFSDLNIDSSANYTLIPISPAQTKNIAIDSVWFTRPVHRIGEEEEIHVKLTNFGNKENNNVTVSLKIDGVRKGIVNAQIPANSSIDTLLKFHTNTVGWHSGSLTIDDFPVVFDNRFYFNYYIKENINIVEVNSNGTNSILKKVYSTEPYFNYRLIKYSKFDFDDLENVNLLIVNSLDNYSTGFISSIKQFVNNGGSLAILPSKINEQQTLNQLLTSCNVPKLSKIITDTIQSNYINLKSSFYQGVFTSTDSKVNLPNIYKYFNFRGNSNGTNLLTTPNSQPILSEWQVKKGKIYLFTIPLDQSFSNFSQHSIFLPTFFQMGFNSGDETNPFYFIGLDELFPVKSTRHNGELIYRIKNDDFNVEVIPEIINVNSKIKLQLHGGIQKAGNYSVTQNDSLVGLVSFNYQRTESNLDYYNANQLNNIIDSLGLTNFSVFETGIESFQSDFKQRETGIELWKWFVILTLLFLGIETVLIRFFKPSVL